MESSEREILAAIIRTEERTAHIMTVMKQYMDQSKENFVTKDELKHQILEAVKQVMAENKNQFVSKEEFGPIKNGFYGICAFIGVAVMTALAAGLGRH